MPRGDTEAWGSELASWVPLTTLLVVFSLIVVGLFLVGRGSPLQRIPEGLQRITGLPGWAAASAGMAAYGLIIAGEGFYSDVAWHIALGRDKELFTAPHTSIVIGLGMIFVAAAVGVVAATVQEVSTRLQWRRLRIPWSTVPLAALGAAALAGFPLDEVWHREYGIDVTMWSPTHMLMILGASFTGLAIWLILAEAGVSPRDSRWARAAHVLAASLALMGLAAPLGEFDFGVPQFQQIFHPVLVTLIAGFVLVAVRLVHGPGWAVGIAVGVVLLELTVLGDPDPLAGRQSGIYVISAVVVEGVAALGGTERWLRFAFVSGVGVATLGLAGEWAWNQGARQQWQSSLLPDAVVLSLLVGVGAAVLGAAFASAVIRQPASSVLPPAVVVIAGVAVLVGLALPMPRRVGDVTAEVGLTPDDRGWAVVRVEVEPSDAAADARWFQIISWQGGGLVLSDMNRTGPGQYVSEQSVPVAGRWKTVLRLHRGGEMMAAPVYFPADPEIDEPEIPAVDRRVELSSEKEFLLRETKDGDAWLEVVVYALLGAVAVGWVAAFTLAASQIGRSRHS